MESGWRRRGGRRHQHEHRKPPLVFVSAALLLRQQAPRLSGDKLSAGVSGLLHVVSSLDGKLQQMRGVEHPAGSSQSVAVVTSLSLCFLWEGGVEHTPDTFSTLQSESAAPFFSSSSSAIVDHGAHPPPHPPLLPPTASISSGPPDFSLPSLSCCSPPR